MGVRALYQRLKYCCIGLVVFLLFIAFNLYYIKPVRNLLLRPVLPKTWRSVDTADILRMRNYKYPPNITDIAPKDCPKLVKPKVKFEDVDQSRIIKYHNANADNPFFQDEKYIHFLPSITWKERVESVYLYLVFAEIMEKLKCSFFFSGGSLLGLVRHEGIIPWDTDLDMAVNGTCWKEVREHLSCLDGFQLRTKWHMHWKFHFRGRFFPFIDVFFFAEDQRYIYAMNYYTLNSVLFEKKDVLPLRLAPYEGLMVPVPNHYEFCARAEYDLEYCYPSSTDHKTGKHFKPVAVKCSSMADYFPIRNVKF